MHIWLCNFDAFNGQPYAISRRLEKRNVKRISRPNFPSIFSSSALACLWHWKLFSLSRAKKTEGRKRNIFVFSLVARLSGLDFLYVSWRAIGKFLSDSAKTATFHDIALAPTIKINLSYSTFLLDGFNISQIILMWVVANLCKCWI